MTKDNINTWGNIPGKFGLTILREVTFFNFTNPEVLFDYKSPQKPKFQLTDPITLQQFNNATNVNFTNSGSEVSFEQITQLKPFGDKNTSQANSVQVANIFGFGVWNYGQGVNLTEKVLKALGSLMFFLIEDDVVQFGVISDALEYASFQNTTINEAYSQYFEPAGLSMDKSKVLWRDPVYGWSNPDGRMYWIQAVERGQGSNIYTTLRLHFNLSTIEMLKLTTLKFKEAVELVQDLVVDLYDCPNNKCDNEFIINSQMATQEFTLNIPDGQGGPMNSFLDVNQTGFGYLELSYYKNGKFLKQFNLTEDANYNGTSVDFTKQQVASLLRVNLEGKGGVAQTDSTLLHPINLDLFIKCGLEFEKSKNEDSFSSILKRFRLKNVYQARMLYQWAKYVAEDFVTLENPKYFETSVETVFFTKYVKRVYTTLTEQLKPFMISQIVLDEIKKSNKSCSQVLSETMSSAEAIKKYCGGTSTPFSIDQIKEIYNFCSFESKKTYPSTKLSKAGISYQQSLFMCKLASTSEGTMAYHLRNADQQIYDQYKGCQLQGFCSTQELISMQWFNSTITNNPLPSIEKVQQKGKSMSTWFDNLTIFEYPFEFDVVAPKFQTPNIQESSIILFYKKLFAPAVIAKAVIDSKKDGNNTFIKEIFGQENSSGLEQYMKHFLRFNVFGGNVLKDKAGTILLNYSSPILADICTSNPLLAGDPTALPFQPLLLSSVNTTFKRHTGKLDTKEANKIISTNGKGYLSIPMPVFDGNKTTIQQVSPWNRETEIQGRDTIFVNGLTENSKIQLYIPDLARDLNLRYVKTNNGKIETLRFELDPSNLKSIQSNPDNVDYNQVQYDGFLNMTTIKKAPVLISQILMEGVDSKMASKVDMVDKEGKEMAYNSETDNFYVDIEPISGAPYKVNYAFQINILVEERDLYDNSGPIILPVAQVRVKTGVLSEGQFDQLFGGLLEAKNVINYSWIMTLLLAIFLIVNSIILLGLLYCVYMQMNDSSSKGSESSDTSPGSAIESTTFASNTDFNGRNEDLHDPFLPNEDKKLS